MELSQDVLVQDHEKYLIEAAHAFENAKTDEEKWQARALMEFCADQITKAEAMKKAKIFVIRSRPQQPLVLSRKRV